MCCKVLGWMAPIILRFCEFCLVVGFAQRRSLIWIVGSEVSCPIPTQFRPQLGERTGGRGMALNQLRVL